jgi:hypothetical protein
MGKFLGAVALLKTSIMEFRYLLDQSGQAKCHWWLPLVLVDQRRKQVPVRQLRHDMHIN